MRFEYYHAGLDDVPKISVDGLVPGSIHFSHWRGNETPAAVKADSSTEIVLNVVSSPSRRELTRGLDLVTNNHFDTDGVLSVWAMLAGERALDLLLPLRAPLVAAAEAGDFSAFTGAQGVRASIVLQGGEGFVPDSGVSSPLARHLAGGREVDEARAYALVLPEVERVITRTDDYEHLWRDEWALIERSLESFARGASRVQEDAETGLSVVTLARDLYGGARGFSPTRHDAPYTAITEHARGSLYLIAVPLERAWGYRVDYPYYSWAETVVRPPITRTDFAPVVRRLDELEQNREEGRWQLDTEGLSSAFNFRDGSGRLRASSLAPDVVAAHLRAALAGLRAESSSLAPTVGG